MQHMQSLWHGGPRSTEIHAAGFTTAETGGKKEKMEGAAAPEEEQPLPLERAAHEGGIGLGQLVQQLGCGQLRAAGAQQHKSNMICYSMFVASNVL